MKNFIAILFTLICFCSFGQSIHNAAQIGQTGRNQYTSRGFWVKADTSLFNSLIWIPANAGASKVLTSDANGFATWQTAGDNLWSLTGNAGTTAGANFIGTSDSIDLVVKTNAGERIRVYANGNFSYTNPITGHQIISTNNALGLGSDFTGEIYVDTVRNVATFTGILNTASNSATLHAFDLTTFQEVEVSVNFFPGIEKLGILLKSKGTTGEDYVGITAFDEITVHSMDTSSTTVAFQTSGWVTNDSVQPFKIYSNGSVQIQDGTQGAGKVLTSDANGRASWQAPKPFTGIVIDSVETVAGAATLTAYQSNIIVASGAITSATLTLPSSPANGDILGITFTQGIATLTYSGGTVVGDPMISSVSIGSIRLEYFAARNVWYQW